MPIASAVTTISSIPEIASEALEPAIEHSLPESPLGAALKQFFLLLPEAPNTIRHLDGRISIVLQLDAQTTSALTPVLLKQSNLTFEKLPESVVPHVTSRVLIVEDDPICRMGLKNILKKIPGIQVTEASNGSEAIALIGTGYIPNLCISDFSMPVMDGLQLLQQFRGNQRLRNMEFILCTTSTERDVIQRAAELRVSQYMVKPFAAAKVTEQVIKLVELAHTNANRRLAELTAQIGVDAATYVTLLRKFGTELLETITSVRTALATESWHSANIRLNALQGAASMLRAQAVLPSLKKTALAVKNHDLTSSMDGLDELAGNTCHIKNEVELLTSELDLASSANPNKNA